MTLYTPQDEARQIRDRHSRLAERADTQYQTDDQGAQCKVLKTVVPAVGAYPTIGRAVYPAKAVVITSSQVVGEAVTYTEEGDEFPIVNIGDGVPDPDTVFAPAVQDGMLVICFNG